MSDLDRKTSDRLAKRADVQATVSHMIANLERDGVQKTGGRLGDLIVELVLRAEVAEAHAQAAYRERAKAMREKAVEVAGRLGNDVCERAMRSLRLPDGS